MEDFILKNPSRELCEKLAEDLKDPSSQFPIEKIHAILAEEYTYEELTIMEAEFILSHILKYIPEIDKDNIDSLFIEKLYAIPAILKQPLLITTSLMAFYNTILICNNITSGYENIEDIRPVPARYIFRMFLAVNAMLPDDMDFAEMYLQPNIRRYIYEMYKRDDAILLDPITEYLSEDFLNCSYSVPQREQFRKIIKDSEPSRRLLRSLLIKTLLKNDKDLSEDDYNLYQTVYRNEEDLSEIRLRMFKYRYFQEENRVLHKYSEDTYEGLVFRKWLDILLYGYFFAYTSTELSNRKIIVAVDFDALSEKETSDGTLSVRDYMTINAIGLSEGEDPVILLYHFGSSGDKNLIKVYDILEEQRPSSVHLKPILLEQGGSPLSEIIKSAYKDYGPPSRLVILTTDSRVKDFRKESIPSLKNWTVSFLT